MHCRASLPAGTSPRMRKVNATLRATPGKSMATTATKQVQDKTVDFSALAHSLPRAPYAASVTEKKLIGYGLPCSHCRSYFPADMDACPICKCPERVSATDRVMHSMVAAEPKPSTATELDDERERLLKELKAQAFASHTQVNTAAAFRCVLDHQHNGATEPAAVCHTCYSNARQQADRMEAALHFDAKEAAKIVYEAVWADTSDPNASYFNAATALLTELRKRAGIGLMLGANQPMAH